MRKTSGEYEVRTLSNFRKKLTTPPLCDVLTIVKDLLAINTVQNVEGEVKSAIYNGSHFKVDTSAV